MRVIRSFPPINTKEIVKYRELGHFNVEIKFQTIGVGCIIERFPNGTPRVGSVDKEIFEEQKK